MIGIRPILNFGIEKREIKKKVIGFSMERASFIFVIFLGWPSADARGLARQSVSI
jgi:hypothetical protein